MSDEVTRPEVDAKLDALQHKLLARMDGLEQCFTDLQRMNYLILVAIVRPPLGNRLLAIAQPRLPAMACNGW
jgi:hypothetical protein